VLLLELREGVLLTFELLLREVVELFVVELREEVVGAV